MPNIQQHREGEKKKGQGQFDPDILSILAIVFASLGVAERVWQSTPMIIRRRPAQIDRILQTVSNLQVCVYDILSALKALRSIVNELDIPEDKSKEESMQDRNDMIIGFYVSSLHSRVYTQAMSVILDSIKKMGKLAAKLEILIGATQPEKVTFYRLSTHGIPLLKQVRRVTLGNVRELGKMLDECEKYMTEFSRHLHSLYPNT